MLCSCVATKRIYCHGILSPCPIFEQTIILASCSNSWQLVVKSLVRLWGSSDFATFPHLIFYFPGLVSKCSDKCYLIHNICQGKERVQVNGKKLERREGRVLAERKSLLESIFCCSFSSKRKEKDYKFLRSPSFSLCFSTPDAFFNAEDYRCLNAYLGCCFRRQYKCW